MTTSMVQYVRRTHGILKKQKGLFLRFRHHSHRSVAFRSREESSQCLLVQSYFRNLWFKRSYGKDNSLKGDLVWSLFSENIHLILSLLLSVIQTGMKRLSLCWFFPFGSSYEDIYVLPYSTNSSSSRIRKFIINISSFFLGIYGDIDFWTLWAIF